MKVGSAVVEVVGYSVDTSLEVGISVTGVVSDAVVGSSVEELVVDCVELSGGDVRGSPVKVSVNSIVEACVDDVTEVVVGARVVVGPSVTDVVGASVEA